MKASIAAALILFTAIASFFLGKSVGQREVIPDSEPTASDPSSPQSVKAIIAKARSKMHPGLFDITGSMEAFGELNALGEHQIFEALEEVKRIIRNPAQEMTFVGYLLARLAETDGPAAMEYADVHFEANSLQMSSVGQAIIAAWARSDPEAVWQWYNEPGDGKASSKTNGREGALISIIGSLAQRDVGLAIERIDSIQNREHWALAAVGLGQVIGDEAKRGEILTQLKQIEDEDQRAELKKLVISMWAGLDHEGVISWIETLDHEARKTAINDVSKVVRIIDPVRTGELLLSASETRDEREAAYVTAIEAWAHNDPVRASEWLSGQDQGPVLDAARYEFAITIASEDLDTAMSFANAITDEEQREHVVSTVYRRWKGKDVLAAKAALEASALPKAKIEKIREMKPF